MSDPMAEEKVKCWTCANFTTKKKGKTDMILACGHEIHSGHSYLDGFFHFKGKCPAYVRDVE